MVGTMGKMLVAAVCLVSLAACGKKDDSGKGSRADDGKTTAPPAAGSEPAPPAAGGASTATWAEAPVSLKASWKSSGEATKDAVLEGTFYVGPRAVRLDIDNHPNAGHPVSFVRMHGEDDLWQIDATTREYDRALSGDWEHDIIPRIIDEDDLDDLTKCPVGYAGKDCVKLGDDSIGGIAVQTWKERNRTFWIAPSLRVSVKEEYTPYRNNPRTQTVVLSNIEQGAQDEALFKMPADYACQAQSFCDGAPK